MASSPSQVFKMIYQGGIDICLTGSLLESGRSRHSLGFASPAHLCALGYSLYESLSLRHKKTAPYGTVCLYGGEGGIRTHGRDKPSPVFKTGAFDRALPPLRRFRLSKTGRRLPDAALFIQPYFER